MISHNKLILHILINVTSGLCANSKCLTLISANDLNLMLLLRCSFMRSKVRIHYMSVKSMWGRRD